MIRVLFCCQCIRFALSHLGVWNIRLITAEKELIRAFVCHYETKLTHVFLAKDFRHGICFVSFFGGWRFVHGKGFEAMKMTAFWHR